MPTKRRALLLLPPLLLLTRDAPFFFFLNSPIHCVYVYVCMCVQMPPYAGMPMPGQPQGPGPAGMTQQQGGRAPRGQNPQQRGQRGGPQSGRGVQVGGLWLVIFARH